MLFVKYDVTVGLKYVEKQFTSKYSYNVEGDKQAAIGSNIQSFI